MINKLFTGIFLLFALQLFTVSAEEMVELPSDCEKLPLSMIKCPIAEGVSMDDAVESMKSRAINLNFKLVAHMPLSKDIEAKGGTSPRMDIYQFCDSLIAAKMVEQNIAFAGFLPCRIALIEDKDKKGQGYLITLDMDSTLGAAKLPDSMKSMALQVRNNIYGIILAGAEGDI